MSEPPRLSCVLIGESNLLLRCAELWTDRGHRIAGVVTADDALAIPAAVYRDMAAARTAIADRPDILFSIVNRTVLSSADIGFATRAAINYHDSALPAYAGVNAPSWAILNGESAHGVTWHLLSRGIDAGNILVQRRFPVAADETALSLSVKCFDHALAAFGELLDAIESGDLRGTPQDEVRRTLFRRAQRLPRQGIIRWTDDAAAIGRFVRAGQLGPYANDFGLPKILLADGSGVVIRKAEPLALHVAEQAGTVVGVDRTSMQVATGTGGAVALDGLALLDGRGYEPPARLRGSRLPVLSRDEERAIDSATVAAVRVEDDVRAALVALPAPLRPAGLRPHKHPDTHEHVFEFDALPHALPGDVFAPILARLWRSHGNRPFLVGISRRVPHAFMPRQPFVCQSGDAAVVGEAIERALRMPPIPADLPLRFPEVRESLLRIDSIAVVLSAEATPPTVNPGLVVWLHGGKVSLRCAAGQIEAREAACLAAALMGRPAADVSPRPSGFRSVPELISQRSSSSPDAIAVEYGTEAISYAELERRVAALAALLHDHGAARETICGILLPQGSACVTAILGVMRSGAAYLPLDPSTPLHRLRQIVADARPLLVITDAASVDRGSQLGPPVIRVDAPYPPAPPAAVVMMQPDDLAYVIYTSGSTGEPKGSMIEHGGLAGFIEADIVRNRIGPDDRVLQLCSPAFDASVEEIFSALCAGATLVVRPATVLDSAAAFVDFCEESRLTIIGIYASMLGDVVTAMERRGRFPATVRLATTGGEMVNAADAARWRDFFAARGKHPPKLFNVYGLTETTVANCCGDLSCVPDLPGEVPIGRPFSENRVRVVDANLAEVEPGKVGELLIAGPQLARAYLDRPALDAARFVRDGVDGVRWFRTGDLVRMSPGGELSFEGRVDRQVKVKGVRIELEDVERAMQAHPEIAHAAAFLHRRRDGGEVLVGCFSPANAGLEDSLRRHLEARLPASMRPRRLVAVDRFPLTDRGKTDHAALAAAIDSDAEASDAAPDDAVDALSRIWRETFPWSDAGDPDESFFDLGGDSLAAVSLLLRVEQETGTRIPVSSFVVEPSLAGLRRLASSDSGAIRSDPVVPLRPDGTGPPIHIVHGFDGDVAWYTALLRRLDAGHPVFGVRSRAILPGGVLPASMAAAATEVLDAIIERQGEPPRVLLGYSWAGILAYEVAVQCARRSDRPPLVILVDAVAPVPQFRSLDILLHLARSVPGWAIRSGPRGWIRSIRRVLGGARLPPSVHQAGAGTSRPMVDHFLALANNYVAPRAPELDIHLIRATASWAGKTPLDLREVHTLWSDYGWGRATGARVRVHRIRCRSHKALLQEPLNAAVADVLVRIVRSGS